MRCTVRVRLCCRHEESQDDPVTDNAGRIFIVFDITEQCGQLAKMVRIFESLITKNQESTVGVKRIDQYLTSSFSKLGNIDTTYFDAETGGRQSLRVNFYIHNLNFEVLC